MLLFAATSVLLSLSRLGRAYVIPSTRSPHPDTFPSAGLRGDVVPRQENATVPFDWATVRPSNEISRQTTVPCFDGFLCGRFIVPLDHSRTDSPNINLAVTILEATAGPQNHKGILLYNPGGPGGSGTEGIVGFGATLRQLVGPGYTLVGFDPRGVGQSEPSGLCFNAEQFAEFNANEVNTFDRRQDVAVYLGRMEIFANKCLEKFGGNGQQSAGLPVEDWGFGRYIGTPNVANDMVLIMRALQSEKINFIGFSYGTALAQYFLAMHPDKVNLMMIDGVVDAESWRKGEQIELFQNSDNVIDAFYELCTRAGPSRCALAESTKEATKKRVNDIIDNLDENPLVVMPRIDSGGVVITAGAFRAVAAPKLSSPFTGFPTLVEFLTRAEARDTEFFNAFGAKDLSGGLSDQTFQMISCADRTADGNLTLDTAVKLAQDADRVADFIDDSVTRDRLRCASWKLPPQNPFEGSFVSEAFGGKLLVVNNMFDPVTPLAHARAAHQRTPNSSLLVQNSIGHIATDTRGSNCIDSAVSTFFQTGELPVTGTVCQPTELPLVGQVEEGIVQDVPPMVVVIQ